jgi:hypothetical protein
LGHCSAPPCRRAVERRRASPTHPMAMEVHHRVPPPHGSAPRRQQATGGEGQRVRVQAGDALPLPIRHTNLIFSVLFAASLVYLMRRWREKIHAAPRGLPRRDLRHLRPRGVAHLPPQLLRDRLRAVRRLQQRRRGGLHHRLPPAGAAAARAGGPVCAAREPRCRRAGGGRGDRGRPRSRHYRAPRP